MADKKTNYADSLKAKPKAAAPDKSKEKIVVDLGGVLTDVYRGNMSDAEWARVKQRAVKEIEVPTEVSYDEPGKLKESDKKQIKASDIEAISRNLDTVSDTIVSSEEKRLLNQTAPENRVKFLRERFLKRDYDVVDEQPAPAVDVGAQKPSQGSPDEWKTPESGQPKKSTGTQTEDDMKVGSRGGSVQGQVAKMLMGAAPDQVTKSVTGAAHSVKKGSFVKPAKNATSGDWGVQEMPEMDLTATQDMPEIDVSPETSAREAQTRRLQNAITQNEIDAGLDLTTPESRLKTAVQRELRDPSPGPAVELGDVSVSPTVTSDDGVTVSRSPVVRPMQFSSDTVDPGVPPQPGMLDTLNQNATQFRQALTDVVTDPVGTLAPVIPMIGNAMGEMAAQGGPFGAPPPRGVPPVIGEMPLGQPPAPPPAPVGPGGSVSMSVKTPGKGGGVKPSTFEDERKMMQEAYTTQNMANALVADQQSNLLSQKASLIRQQQDESAALAARQAAMESARAERMKRGEAGLMKLQSRLADLESQSPDPNRFWNNKSDGQKAAAVIAGALFGFTGQGMQWLQRLDGLVESDIQQQAQELQRKGGLLNKQIDVQNNLVAMARQQGLDESESISAARIAMTNKYALMFEQAAATTGSEAVKAQALANAGVLRQKMAQDMMDMKVKTNEAAQKAALNAAHIDHLRMQTFAIGAKAAGDARESQTFKPAQQERISEMLSLGKKIGEMHGKWKEQAGSPFSPLTSNLGLGMQVTDASKWKGSTQKFFAQTIGKPLEGGRMTDADFPKYLEGFIPSATDTTGAAENKTKNLIKYAVDRYTDELRSLQAANVQGIDRLPTPAQYEMKLLQDAGIGQDAPTYATPR
jgi:hypothetical protein